MTATTARKLTDRGQYLSTACDILWPPPVTVTLGGSGPGRASPGTPDREYLLLLGPRKPRLLVPAAASASAAAVRGFGPPQSAGARIGARALILALRGGAGRAAPRARLRVHVPAGAETIESYLRDVLGHDVLVSLHLGGARANRKPVLQLLTPAGQPAGFAKIGVNPLTRRLVEAEYHALRSLDAGRLPGLMAPRVRHYGEWHAMNVLVLSTLPVWQRRAPVTADRLAAAVRAVAAVGEVRREPLVAGSYGQGLTSRLAAADASPARASLRAALEAVADRAGDTTGTLGSWHGDLAPWNMLGTRDALLVWDWERFSGSGVPLGFDALHYQLQKDLLVSRREPPSVAADCISGAPALLAPLGLEPAQARLTAVLYLAELATRYLADRQAEAGAALGEVGSWLLPAIEQEAGRL